MTIPNHITLETLPRLPVAEIVALPAEELGRLQHEAEEALRKAKLTVAWLDGALTMKYADRAKAARGDAGKDFGVARFFDGGVQIVADLPKRVEWDQRELAEIVERIKAQGEDPLEYIDVAFKVSERKYGSWPAHIRRAFEPARSVRAGAQSFELISKDMGDA